VCGCVFACVWGVGGGFTAPTASTAIWVCLKVNELSKLHSHYNNVIRRYSNEVMRERDWKIVRFSTGGFVANFEVLR
jgi:hypothetical protein